MKRQVSAAIGTVSLSLLPTASQAHIKWFCSYDTTVPPLPPGDVLTPAFAWAVAWFSTMMFLAYTLDLIVDRNGWLRRMDSNLMRCAPAIPYIVRSAVGSFFLVLWAGGTTILTPELRTSAVWVPWLQLAIALSTLWRGSLIFTAIGINILYLYGVLQYGAFHMMDYPIFIGLSLYLGLGAYKATADSPFRLPALYFNMALTMAWGGIEKLAYPYWTFPLLSDHRGLTFSIPFGTFMTVAGLVELSLAFFMVTGTALLRLACLALLTIMTAAVPEFGKIDAIGHFLMIVTLIAMIIVGQNGIRPPLVVSKRNPLLHSGILTAAYGSTFVCLFGLYYGAQFIAGR